MVLTKIKKMKSINIKGVIAILLIIVLGAGIVATGYHSMKPNSVLVLKATGKITQQELNRSAEIITQRLKSAGSRPFDIKPAGNGMLEIRLGEGWDYDLAKNLACNKGALAFYETLKREEMQKDEALLQLLQADEHQTAIGCATGAAAGKVDDYLRTTEPNRSYRLSWTRNGNVPRCLYALKLNADGSPVLMGADVSSIRMERGASDHDYAIGISFKDDAIKKWATVTERNLNRAIAIAVDDEVFYAPVVKSPMHNGLCQVTGNFPDVSYFVALTSHGMLPVKFEAFM